MTREEGIALAQEYGCSFFECSAKTRENVEKCFEELALKVLTLKCHDCRFNSVKVQMMTCYIPTDSGCS